ncbi:MAG TPA: hypothetical protein VJ801_17070 [Polyangia bacterium]|jgi:hypothetical protein|nr:hypothetical protein [Polyangia bacterium]
MTMATNGSVAATVAVARKSLDNACDDLDDAVRAFPDVPDDNVMANPGLVALLLRVVVARRHLSGFERSLAAESAGCVWASTPQ